jgi:hypothetical protein
MKVVIDLPCGGIVGGKENAPATRGGGGGGGRRVGRGTSGGGGKGTLPAVDHDVQDVGVVVVLHV